MELRFHFGSPKHRTALLYSLMVIVFRMEVNLDILECTVTDKKNATPDLRFNLLFICDE